MKRNEHVFMFTGEEISNAAFGEYKYHSDKVAMWKGEQQSVLMAAQQSSAEIREYDVTGGKRIELVMPDGLQNRLNECATKVKQHQDAADRFQIEAHAYGSQAKQMFPLHPDDIIYFRLAGMVRSL